MCVNKHLKNQRSKDVGHIFCIPCSGQESPIKEGLSVLPSFCPSFCLPFHLSMRFLGIISLILSKFWLGARKPYEFVRGRAGFSEKNYLPRKLGKWTKNGPKTGFIEFIEKFGH